MSGSLKGAALAVTLALGLGSSPPTWAQFVPPILDIPDYATEQLADGLYSFRWGSYRNIFVITDEGVIVTDPMSVDAAAVYRAEIAKLTDQPVKYLVYSHSHWDHVTGGQIFKDEGAQVIAQERCAKNIAARNNGNIVPPDVTFSDTYRVELGGRGLDLYYFGPSDDTCAIVMVPRPHPMVFIVDSVNPGAGGNIPWNPMIPDFQPYNVVQFFQSVEDLAVREGITTLIGGHISIIRGPDGKPALASTTGPIEEVTKSRETWDRLIEAVKIDLDKGTPAAQIPDTMDLSQFSDIPGYSEEGLWVMTRRIAAMFETGR